MKILVTGAGAGYIGSIRAPRLLEEGHEVLAVDNFMYRQVTLLDCFWERLFLYGPRRRPRSGVLDRPCTQGGRDRSAGLPDRRRLGLVLKDPGRQRG